MGELHSSLLLVLFLGATDVPLKRLDDLAVGVDFDLARLIILKVRKVRLIDFAVIGPLRNLQWSLVLYPKTFRAELIIFSS